MLLYQLEIKCLTAIIYNCYKYFCYKLFQPDLCLRSPITNSMGTHEKDIGFDSPPSETAFFSDKEDKRNFNYNPLISRQHWTNYLKRIKSRNLYAIYGYMQTIEKA